MTMINTITTEALYTFTNDVSREALEWCSIARKIAGLSKTTFTWTFTKFCDKRVLSLEAEGTVTTRISYYKEYSDETSVSISGGEGYDEFLNQLLLGEVPEESLRNVMNFFEESDELSPELLRTMFASPSAKEALTSMARGLIETLPGFPTKDLDITEVITVEKLAEEIFPYLEAFDPEEEAISNLSLKIELFNSREEHLTSRVWSFS
jgi:hypothetical protein